MPQLKSTRRKAQVIPLRRGQPSLEKMERSRDRWERISALYKRQIATNVVGQQVSVLFKRDIEAAEFARLLKTR